MGPKNPLDFLGNYNPRKSEQKWLEFWDKEKIYSFNPKSKAEIYSVDTPPPTVSGKMHLGHSFSYAQQDFVVRFQRMLGKNVFYPFGTDDNGLATERMIERMKNVKGQFMKRKDFVDLCLKTLEEIRPDFMHDWKKIGISADFGIFYTTINEHCQRISQRSFIELYKMKRCYRKEGPTIWCPECHTAIAQVEMKDEEKMTNLVYIEARTEAGQPLVFATTRPELYPSCVGISVNPKDERYKKHIGQKIIMPLTNARIELTTDEMIEPEFGTGAVYFCSSGDAQFLDWETRHPVKDKIYILNFDGTMNEKAGAYVGLTIKETRKKIVEDLSKLGVVKKVEPLKHAVNVHERCGTAVEYMVSKQWYIKYLDLKDDFIKYGRKIKWRPEHMRVRYENWVNGLKWDWNISRQRHFGIPIPVWYCRKCNEIFVAEENQLPVDPLVDRPLHKCKCGSNEFNGEKDVLDTWATSSLTPQIAIELFDKKTQKKLFPMSLRPQAHDIITFWLFNTIVKSYFHHESIPWKEVMISGFVLDPHGKKMSKSKGNVIEPQFMINKYSADALRFWAAGSRLGDDMPFQEKDLVTGSKFITKIWNASKFAFMHFADYNGKRPAKLEMMDRWVLSKLSKVIKTATENFMNYEYSHTKLATETFFWHTFCDNYLEIIKDRIYNAEQRGKEPRLSAQYGLYQSLLAIIKLMAPIIPFITEELYQMYFKSHGKEKSIHLTKWPDIEMIDEHAERIGDFVVGVVEFVRKQKTAKQVSLKTPVKRLTIKASIEEKDFDGVELEIKAATSAEHIVFEPMRGKAPEKALEIELEF
ncbi:valine--tRNA ligase [Candidatus Woesearchaeota archaeon]|nr:valine--tRNA ligase [Candidatus Woesearchaeota archaeon]